MSNDIDLKIIGDTSCIRHYDVTRIAENFVKLTILTYDKNVIVHPYAYTPYCFLAPMPEEESIEASYMEWISVIDFGKYVNVDNFYKSDKRADNMKKSVKKYALIGAKEFYCCRRYDDHEKDCHSFIFESY